MEKKHQINLVYFLIEMLVILAFQGWWAEKQAFEPIPYSDFQSLLKEGKIADIQISQNMIRGTFKDTSGSGPKGFVTTRVDPEIAADLDKYHVKFSGVIESHFLSDLLS